MGKTVQPRSHMVLTGSISAARNCKCLTRRCSTANSCAGIVQAWCSACSGYPGQRHTLAWPNMQHAWARLVCTSCTTVKWEGCCLALHGHCHSARTFSVQSHRPGMPTPCMPDLQVWHIQGGCRPAMGDADLCWLTGHASEGVQAAGGSAAAAGAPVVAGAVLLLQPLAS